MKLTRRTWIAALASLVLPPKAIALGDNLAPSIRTAQDAVFDAGAYIDAADAAGLHSLVIYRESKRIMFGIWLPENCGGDPTGSKCEAFIAELHRRGRAFHALPGESANAAEARIRKMPQFLALTHEFG